MTEVAHPPKPIHYDLPRRVNYHLRLWNDKGLAITVSGKDVAELVNKLPLLITYAAGATISQIKESARW